VLFNQRRSERKKGILGELGIPAGEDV